MAVNVSGVNDSKGRRKPTLRDREREVKVVKLLPVSTGQLRWLPTLHSRPINLVVFQGALGQLSNETSSWEGLRA